jgi:hypothetical protein
MAAGFGKVCRALTTDISPVGDLNLHTASATPTSTTQTMDLARMLTNLFWFD